MKKAIRKRYLKAMVVFLAIFSVAVGCRKRDALLPDNLVGFQSAAQGITENDSSITLKVQLSRATDKDIPVVVNLTPLGISYGNDFTTTPAAVAGSLSLVIPSGNNEASFAVKKTSGSLFDGDEKIVFDIYSSGSPVIIGSRRQLTLSFAELVANSANATINGGGASFPNKVFIDLSAIRQTAVLRTNWDLGFYTGSDDYRVILNSSSAMMAKRLNKNDLTQVTASDTAGLLNELSFSQMSPSTSQLPYIDYPNGDLTKTAIASVAAVAADNMVYIVNRGTGVGTPATARGWKKIRVIRNGTGGYILQHADISSSNYQEITIPKDEGYFFKYISFDNGLTNVEPAKNKWDIAWTFFSNVTNFGGGEVPYLFQDIILLNRNVQSAKVMVATKPFGDFSEADLAGLSFSNSQVAIGADWRSGGGPGVSPAVRTDRYYILRDGSNNYYKLRFTALTQNGERGYPAFEIVLVKRG